MFDLPGEFLRGVQPRERTKEFVHVPIVNVDTRGPLRFIPLSEEWWGVFLHHDGRSIICTGKEHCKCCQAKLAKRWAGFWSCCSLDLKQLWVVKVSEGAALQLQTLRNRQQHLVGLPIMFRRSGARLNSPVRVELLPSQQGPLRLLPSSFDPRGVVLYVHGYCAEDVNLMLRMPDREREADENR